jgi:hypothetical protein
MPWQKLPEGYKSPGYVIVSIYTPEGQDAIINVYGMYETLAIAKREQRRMIRETREHGANELDMQRWSLFPRKVADIDQMNRLMDEEEKK